MNRDELWNRRWVLTNARRSYNDVESLLGGFRVGKDFRQSACLQQRVFVEKVALSHFLLEALVDREKAECSQEIDQNGENHIPSRVSSSGSTLANPVRLFFKIASFKWPTVLVSLIEIEYGRLDTSRIQQKMSDGASLVV